MVGAIELRGKNEGIESAFAMKTACGLQLNHRPDLGRWFDERSENFCCHLPCDTLFIPIIPHLKLYPFSSRQLWSGCTGTDELCPMTDVRWQ